jgi:hypothetical protein
VEQDNIHIKRIVTAFVGQPQSRVNYDIEIDGVIVSHFWYMNGTLFAAPAQTNAALSKLVVSLTNISLNSAQRCSPKCC